MGQDAIAATVAATPSETTTAEPSNDELASILKGNKSGARSQKPEGEGTDDEPADDPDGENLDAEGEEGKSEEGSQKPETRGQKAEGEGSDEAETETEDDQGTDNEAQDPDAELDEDSKKARAKLSPEQQKLFDKAVSKKTRRIIELRTETESLKTTLAQRETELEEARNAQPAAVVVPTAENPLAGINDAATLDAKVTSMRALRSWARRNPQGGVIKDQDGKEIEITPERAAEMLDEAENVIEEAEPRRKFLQTRAAAQVEAVKAYPWLKDKRAPGTVVIEDIKRRRPGLMEMFPDVDIALADMLVGAHMRQQGQAKGAAPKATPDKKTAPKAPSTPGGGARPPKVSAAAKTATGATAVLEKTGEDPGNATLSSLLFKK